MGNMEGRIARLEEASRERAEARIKALYDGLTDEELALVLAPFGENPVGGVALSEADEARRRDAEEKLDSGEVERLIEIAAPPGVLEDPEECDRWMWDLVERVVFPGGRAARLRRLLRNLEEREPQDG